jgi:hypothetical protein
VFLTAASSRKRSEERYKKGHDHQDDDDQVGDADLKDVPMQVMAERIQWKYGGERQNIRQKCLPDGDLESLA